MLVTKSKMKLFPKTLELTFSIIAARQAASNTFWHENCLYTARAISFSNLPPAAAGKKREKEFFGDTPNPGRDAALPTPSLVPKMKEPCYTAWRDCTRALCYGIVSIYPLPVGMGNRKKRDRG
jgi:hypothetical protein